MEQRLPVGDQLGLERIHARLEGGKVAIIAQLIFSFVANSVMSCFSNAGESKMRPKPNPVSEQD